MQRLSGVLRDPARLSLALTRRLHRAYERLDIRRAVDVAYPSTPAYRWDRYLIAAIYGAGLSAAVPDYVLPLVQTIAGNDALWRRTTLLGRPERRIEINRDY